jgi:glucokinase
MRAKGGPLVIAIDIGGTNLRAALVDRRGRIFARQRHATVLTRSGLVAQLTDIIRKARTKESRVAAVGIGFPGPMKIKKGIVLTPPNIPDCANLPLKKILEKATRLPVFLENDANAAALGEYWIGAAKGAHSVLCLTLGTGIGGGIVLDGKVWRGAGDVAGELGHITVKPGGRKCGCGKRGCLETYASASGVARTARARIRRGDRSAILRLAGGKISAVNSAVVHRAAMQGDRAAREVLHETGRILGAAIGNLLNVLNPAVVVLTGGLARAGSLLFRPLIAEAPKHCFRAAFRGTRIVRGKLGDDAGIAGAALTAFQELENI